jgi:tetratricopeptide (TPR) repeat protein
VGTLLVRRREEPARQDAAADRFLALVSALCFALHPLQVETVAWISELKGELAAMFGLLGLLLHYRSGKRVLPAGCLVIAMLAKPSAIDLPGVLFLVNRILLGLDLRKSITLPGLYALLLLPLVLVTKRLQPDTELDFIPTVGERLQVAADALTFYLAKVLVPYPLAVDYGRTPQFVLHLPGWRVALSLLMLIAAVAAVATALLRPRPAGPGHWRSWVSCGGAVFLLSVAPNLGLVPFGFQQYSTVSDHYLYLALLGGSLAAGGLMVRFGHLALSRRIAAAVLLAFAFLSFWQARLWRSTESLFTHTLKVNPRSHLGYHTVAEEHLREGRFDLAVEWGQRSLALKPDYLPAAVSLGLALARTGDHAKAIDHYRSALARHPSTVGTRARLVSSLHNNLGMLLLQTGQEAEGAAQFRQAIAVFPRSFNARMNLGNLALEQHRYADAIAEYEAAQALSPSNPLVRQRLEIARQGARPAAH